MNGFRIIGSWSGNIDMPEKAPNVASDGLLLCYGIFISFTRKVASRVKSDGLKAMLWRRVETGWLTALSGVIWRCALC